MKTADSMPPAYANPRCECAKFGANPMFCPYGHLTECHYPFDCAEANCSHYQDEEDDMIDIDPEIEATWKE